MPRPPSSSSSSDEDGERRRSSSSSRRPTARRRRSVSRSPARSSSSSKSSKSQKKERRRRKRSRRSSGSSSDSSSSSSSSSGSEDRRSRKRSKSSRKEKKSKKHRKRRSRSRSPSAAARGAAAEDRRAAELALLKCLVHNPAWCKEQLIPLLFRLEQGESLNLGNIPDPLLRTQLGLCFQNFGLVKESSPSSSSSSSAASPAAVTGGFRGSGASAGVFRMPKPDRKSHKDKKRKKKQKKSRHDSGGRDGDGDSLLGAFEHLFQLDRDKCLARIQKLGAHAQQQAALDEDKAERDRLRRRLARVAEALLPEKPASTASPPASLSPPPAAAEPATVAAGPPAVGPTRPSAEQLTAWKQQQTPEAQGAEMGPKRPEDLSEAEARALDLLRAHRSSELYREKQARGQPGVEGESREAWMLEAPDRAPGVTANPEQAMRARQFLDSRMAASESGSRNAHSSWTDDPMQQEKRMREAQAEALVAMAFREAGQGDAGDQEPEWRSSNESVESAAAAAQEFMDRVKPAHLRGKQKTREQLIEEFLTMKAEQKRLKQERKEARKQARGLELGDDGLPVAFEFDYENVIGMRKAKNAKEKAHELASMGAYLGTFDEGHMLN